MKNNQPRPGPKASDSLPGANKFAQLNLIGQSNSFTRMLRRIERVAQCDATVLLEGETGTGKEVAARGIHDLGVRHGFPFVPVNCGAIPDNLVENELFGHVKWAFTDAKNTQLGLVDHADGGTLFLDEVECLSPKGQVVLLRFLQDHAYRPLGGQQQRHANVRTIAASNRDLAQMASNGEFRKDLFYRLTVLSVSMPPLRERGTDAVLLAEHFIRRFAYQYGTERLKLDDESVSNLLGYEWPGNVRELENLIHREFLLAEGSHIRARLPARSDLDEEPAKTLHQPLFHLGYNRAKAVVLAEFERQFLTRALAETGGNVSAAARLVGKERRAFGKLLKKHGIDRRRYQSG